jgi:hypothetical protein
MKKLKKSIQFGYTNHMLKKMDAEPEPATSKQLWTINYLSLKLGQEHTLPMTKYDASLVIQKLKLAEWEKDNEQG